jgi:hypothetical protein
MIIKPMEGAEGNASAPDFVAPLEGWRIWMVTAGVLVEDLTLREFEQTPIEELRRMSFKEMARLYSLFDQSTWPHKKEMVAECKCRCACGTCGLYCLRSEVEALFGLLHQIASPGYKEGRHRAVIGKVDFWGTVHEHEWGYRAEYMYPKELWVAPSKDELLPFLKIRNLLEDGYGVPVGYLSLRSAVGKFRGELEYFLMRLVESDSWHYVNFDYSGFFEKLCDEWEPMADRYSHYRSRWPGDIRF